jgi:hypothetical protein
VANLAPIGYHAGRSETPFGVDNGMIEAILRSCKQLISHVKQSVKAWIKPITIGLVTGSISDVMRSRADLIAENALLRQQLIILRRQVKRPQLTKADRIRLVLLARCTQFWQQALHIVRPDTLIRWHRDLFRRYWRRKSKHKNRKPRIAPETIASSGGWPRKTGCGARSASAANGHPPGAGHPRGV